MICLSLDKEVAFVSAIAFLFVRNEHTLADIPRSVERREYRIHILSLLPPNHLTIP